MWKKNNELDEKTQKAISDAKEKELKAQTAEKKYNDQFIAEGKDITDKFKKS